MNEAQDIVDRMKKATKSTTNTSLAKILNVGGSTIRTWIVRNSVPLEKCMVISEQFNTPIEWILKGENEKESTKVDANISTEELRSSLMEGLFTAIQVRAITVQDGVKIGDIADILMTELQEKHSAIFSEKVSKAS